MTPWIAPNQPAQNKVATVPAPTGGLNSRDALANMPETDAIVLNNWWPEPYGLSVRPGSILWASGIPGGSGMLATWSNPDGDLKLFTVGSGYNRGEYTGAIFDVSSRMGPLDPPLEPAYVGIADTKPRTLQVSNDGGAHLFFISGGGAPTVVYNSTGFHEILVAAGPAPEPPADYTWYDGPGNNTNQMTSHQGRLWATDSQSSVGWYLPVDAIYGQWSPFDFGPQFTLGGGISYMTTWTIDDGNGAEDHLVVVSTEGQAVVYGGTDPSDIATWALVGVYTVGQPVGSPGKGFVKVGGDLILLTQRGLVSMARLLVSTKVNSAVNAVNSEKVQPIIAEAVTVEPGRFEWQLFYHPPSNLFLVNMPPGDNQIVERQLAANLVVNTVPWTAFTGIPATHWVTFDNSPYFGTADGRIYKAWTGWYDEVDLSDANGKEVRTQVQQAYSYLGAPAVQKQVGMYRPGFLVKEQINFGAVIEYDFTIRRLRIPSAGFGQPGYDLWDESTSLWDGAVWSSGVVPDRRWIQAQGIGVDASLRMSMSSKSEILWVSTDYSYKVGGLL